MGIYLIALLIFILGTMFKVFQLYYIVLIILGVNLALKYMTIEALKKLTCVRNISSNRIFRGEKTEINLNLKNNSIWPIFWLEFNEAVPVKLHSSLTSQITSLAPQEKVSQQYTLKGKERGLYNLGVCKGQLGDGLGLVEKKFTFDTGQQLIVYPQVFPLEDLGLPSRIAFGDLIWPQKIYRDPTSFRGLREYQKGDQIKDVYWPATASLNQLMVKEYESTIAVENLIFLNLKQQDYGVKNLSIETELAIEVAASVAKYLVDCNQTVGLATNGEDEVNNQELIAAGQGAGQLMDIMEFLARLEITKEQSYLNLIEKYSQQATPGSTLLLITKTDGEELVTKALQLCRQGLNVVIIVLGKDVLHQRYLNRSYTENLVIYQIKRKEDFYAWGS
ncbi:DUF58 domain-containing protein [Halanaerobacter jeridensis]|uniref:Uncharacterized protein (DUF58 family) n=1 Tax=Halanaerobacter jeridensis TaxID=706427 RepID=A0A938XTC1_9FIRM|nr:DUF58 domain-containing protein [Halanaerobacter jeridensis]MBM7557371.1 uncharacterized protein (DUF58 family) [Halanaerobacter jeridensis]